MVGPVRRRVAGAFGVALAFLVAAGLARPAAAQAPGVEAAQACLSGLRQSREAFREMARELPRFYGRSVIGNRDHVILIDYTIPQTKRRLYVVDLPSCRVIHTSRIIHGGAWYMYRKDRPDPSWAWSRAKQAFYQRINLNTVPMMLTTCRNSVKGGSTHMTRPGWQYTGTCHTNANEGWTTVRTQSCTGYGIQVRPLEGQALGGVTFHDHIRLRYDEHVGQGSLGFERGGTQALIDAIARDGGVNITRGTLVYVHAPQCS